MQVTAKSVQYSTVIYFISIKSKEYIQVHQNSVQLSTPELSAVYDIKDPSTTMRKLQCSTVDLSTVHKSKTDSYSYSTVT